MRDSRTFRVILCLICLVPLVVSSTAGKMAVGEAETANFIELKEFRWTRFPLKVLVEMNSWSRPDYAVAVHEALNEWMGAIWNFTHSYTDTSLTISYEFYLSNVNFTSTSDVTISFAQDLIQRPDVVGLTSYQWNTRTHLPDSPITIKITTYSATANYLFVKDIALHELGHALGLGHASSPTTLNGPELMFASSSLDEEVYPSTLDVYGLTLLYDGNFGKTVQLPSDIPYKMLAEAQFPLSSASSFFSFLYPSVTNFRYIFTSPQQIFSQPMILLIPSAIWMVIALVLALVFCSKSIGAFLALFLSFIVAFYLSLLSNDLDLLSLGLKIAPLLPSIVLGAVIGASWKKRLCPPTIDYGEPSTINQDGGQSFPS
ncbi:MAG: matrixin family metalloprotease [Candidatus Bathyarchaeota archaeon]